MSSIERIPLDPPGGDDPRLERPGAEPGAAVAGVGRRRRHRPLTEGEIELLVRNGNTCEDWGRIAVGERFDARLARGSRFEGMIRIGDLTPARLRVGELSLPVGIVDSTIVGCELGDDVAIHHVRYLSRYTIGDEVILFDIGEMTTSERARFGHGVAGPGEDDAGRNWIDVWNENGGRAILPFAGMRPADAYLWARHRGDAALMERFKALTDALFAGRRGGLGTVGARALIKHTRAIRDAAIGAYACIEGANLIEDVTILSDADEPSRIGEGCELAHGIVGHGCEVHFGAMAERFVLGTRVALKHGARVINSFVGDNSTVACCEVLNSLIFPAHEQHHNNSFLIAAHLQGQSNIAAGATVGSNHNSRAGDGEIFAGRGFWPGLCTNFKHNCRFASFTLVAKGNYDAELNVPLPFSLVSNSADGGRLVIIPAYWFLYNMYAVTRNAWKFRQRDKRVHRDQPIEFDYLAPDTVEEMFSALELLELWTGKASVRDKGAAIGQYDPEHLRTIGRGLLREQHEAPGRLEVFAEEVENAGRPVQIVKYRQAYAAYREMIHYYAVGTLARHVERSGGRLDELAGRFNGVRPRRWANLGGQLVPEADVEELEDAVKSGRLDSWGAVHDRLDGLWKDYAEQRARHAWGSLLAVGEPAPAEVTPARWREALERAAATQRKIADLTYASRAKDYSNPFRARHYESEAEMDAVLGRLEDNVFIVQAREETETFCRMLARLKERIRDEK